MYQPKKEILEKYADLLINFALGSGNGIKKKEVVYVVAEDVAKPFLFEIRNAILRSGGFPIIKMIPTGDWDKTFFELANEDQIKFFPKKYNKALVDLADHYVGIIADTDLKELAEIDPVKILMSKKAGKLMREWMNKKENAGKFTWTLANFGTEAMAREAMCSLEEYWDQIISACFLDEKDPKKKWKEIFSELDITSKFLNSLKIDSVHVEGENIDLIVKIGEKRKWVSGSGRNIPSFEIFTSPDWRGTNGFIKFNNPVYRYGNFIKGAKFEFKNGILIKSSAEENSNLLKNIVAQKNANKLGEFSLTDARISKIRRFMADILYDENVGGEFGNMHVAIGASYHDTFDGDVMKQKKSDWKNLGFNESVEHLDFINTEKKVVTATLSNGEKRKIYENGKFLI
ncbi:MAG: aminopeptidase [Patescibacteria group bacterium]